MSERWPRPKVMKMGGEWVWTCSHTLGMLPSHVARGWADPWTAAMAGATAHWLAYHDEAGTVVEEGEL